MPNFNILTSSCVPLPVEHVDTDQIIPARFLKATTREGFGDNLFRDWRYESDNTPKEGFVLNNPGWSGRNPGGRQKLRLWFQQGTCRLGTGRLWLSGGGFLLFC